MTGASPVMRLGANPAVVPTRFAVWSSPLTVKTATFLAATTRTPASTTNVRFSSSTVKNLSSDSACSHGISRWFLASYSRLVCVQASPVESSGKTLA